MATKPPEPGLPVERIVLVAALGLGAILFVWGAGRLLRPKPKPAPIAAPAPPPPPPAPVEEDETSESSFPSFAAPTAAPAAPAPTDAAVAAGAGNLTANPDGTWSGDPLPVPGGAAKP